MGLPRRGDATDSTGGGMELRDYLRGLRRHWIAILLMTLVGAGAGYGWTLLQTPVYVAGSSGYVSSTGDEDLGESTLGDSLARSKVPTYLEIAEWRTVADYAIEELDLNTTPEALVQRIEVSCAGGGVDRGHVGSRRRHRGQRDAGFGPRHDPSGR
jgi:uncharacterized protein involved in exopolysaccharide biosynthesis